MAQNTDHYHYDVKKNGIRLNANEPLIVATGGTVTLPATTTIGGSSVSALGVITSTSANALTVGRNGTTNPQFNVDDSTSSAATGLNVKGAAAAGGLAVTVISSGTDESLTVDAKGAGTVTIAGTSTGNITLGSTSNLVNFAQTEIASGTTSIITLGNYGGTGRPTAAAQDGWLKIKVAGTDKWLPVWA
jgi:hypothetical protein